VKVLRVGTESQSSVVDVVDAQSLVSQRYDLRPGTVYLFRRDQHVCARWRKPTVHQVKSAIKRALAVS